MAVLQGAGRICPPHMCVIQKTPMRNRVKEQRNYQLEKKDDTDTSLSFPSRTSLWYSKRAFYL